MTWGHQCAREHFELAKNHEDLLHDGDSADALAAGYLSGGEDAAEDMLNVMDGCEYLYNEFRVIHLNNETEEEPVVLATAKIC